MNSVVVTRAPMGRPTMSHNRARTLVVALVLGMAVIAVITAVTLLRRPAEESTSPATPASLGGVSALVGRHSAAAAERHWNARGNGVTGPTVVAVGAGVLGPTSALDTERHWHAHDVTGRFPSLANDVIGVHSATVAERHAHGGSAA